MKEWGSWRERTAREKGLEVGMAQGLLWMAILSAIWTCSHAPRRRITNPIVPREPHVVLSFGMVKCRRLSSLGSCVSLSMLTQNKKFGKRLAWPIQRLVAASSYQTWYGLNCVFPPKWRLPQKKCWGPNPWYLRMWLYLERGSLQM